MPSRPYAPYAAPPPARRWRALLVLGLLAGLLGMHALAPVIATASPSPAHHVPGGATPHGHQRPVGDTAHGHRASTGVTAHAHCPGAGDCGGGHVHHADPTCASAALDGPPAAPALAPSPLGPVRPSHAAGGGGPARQHCGRAPPSLAELQLLRI
ncbi:DUF6153 family protein [Streptomyces lydicus]|uniref:DUF6153 family protein n=1 Tax=Streptomyces lydicus TaxID=47763 RepID=UPI0019D6FDB1|nr:DUF6153 family protein [Streptomyces lydicus]UEG90212.1 DUF6153 family protein [Streptomyces lydicus]